MIRQAHTTGTDPLTVVPATDLQIALTPVELAVAPFEIGTAFTSKYQGTEEESCLPVT